LKTLKNGADVGSAEQGGYMIKKRENATVTLLASGSEVMLCLQAGCHLEAKGIHANIVSMPCMELFNEQDQAYRDSVIDPSTKVMAVEAASGLEWYQYADKVLGMKSFGASGDASELFKHFGFTIENVQKEVFSLLNKPYNEEEQLKNCNI